jgi:hypothetical protein
MPLPLPNLDDHDYSDLVEMARSLIPSECPEWTDHNPSDTGIILLELFAWLTDLLLYQVNQVPDASQEVFLQLLNGNAKYTVNPKGGKFSPQELQEATRETILELRKRYRAVTVQDYEALVMENFQVGRVKAFKNKILSPNSHAIDSVGHISLVVIPKSDQDIFTSLDSVLQDNIWKFLDSRRLLATRHHIVGPEYVRVTISAELHLEAGWLLEKIESECKKQLSQFFDPLKGGEDREGWPFGRAVYLSEIYQQLDQVEGVDYVEKIQIKVNQAEFQSLDEQYKLKDHQLVHFEQFILDTNKEVK